MFRNITIKDVKNNIANWCKTLRKADGLSQQQLANELNLSRITISKLENGENFTIETLLKVLQHFNQMDTFNDFVVNNTNTDQSLY